MLILWFWKGPGLGGEQSPFQVFVVPPKTHKKVTVNGLGQSCDKYDPWWHSDHAGSGHCDRHSSKFLGQRLDMFNHFGGRVSRNWRPCKSNEFLHCGPTWNMSVYACNRNRQFRVIVQFTEWPQCWRLYQDIGFVEPCSCSSIFDLKRLDSFPLSLKRFHALFGTNMLNLQAQVSGFLGSDLTHCCDLIAATENSSAPCFWCGQAAGSSLDSSGFLGECSFHPILEEYGWVSIVMGVPQ